MSGITCMYECICTVCLGVWCLQFALLIIFYSGNIWNASIAFSPPYIGTTNAWQRTSQTKHRLFKLDYAIASLFDLLCDELWNIRLGVEMMQESSWKSILFLRNIQVRITCTGVGKTLWSWEETFGARSRNSCRRRRDWDRRTRLKGADGSRVSPRPTASSTRPGGRSIQRCFQMCSPSSFQLVWTEDFRHLCSF